MGRWLVIFASRNTAVRAATGSPATIVNGWRSQPVTMLERRVRVNRMHGLRRQDWRRSVTRDRTSPTQRGFT